MKKKSINQIVIYFYTAAFCILAIALSVCTVFISRQNKNEHLQQLKTYVSSAQNSLSSTINSMEYMHRLLYPHSLNMLIEYNEDDKIDMLDTLFICRDLNNEYFYSVLFYPDDSYKIVTSDINADIIEDIYRIYKHSDKNKKYTEFFYNPDKNPNMIYLYNSQPVLYNSTSDIECYTLGISVLITPINITEYSMNFNYSSLVELSLVSENGDVIPLSKRKNDLKPIGEYEYVISRTGWAVRGNTAYNSNLFEHQTLFKLFILQAFFTILSLLAIFQIIYKKYILRPINQISNFLNGYVMLNHTVEIPKQTSYEFDKIASCATHMAHKNRELMRRIFKNQQTIYEKEIENRSYQFYALKAQINPHFLYNTLDCISSLAYINDIKPVANITNILSKILRYTITDSSYTVLKNEISLMENYFEIIKIRYPGKVNYKINVDEKLLECKMLHMLLQPFVENSVKHNNLLVKKLLIYIKAYTEGNTLKFVIMDNGTGISDEQMRAFNEKLALPVSFEDSNTPKSKHIGIQNINSRIKLTYGNEYGIKIDGKKDKYIKISVTIPLEK